MINSKGWITNVRRSASPGELHMGNWCDQTQSNSSANEERQTSFHTGCTGTTGKRVCRRADAKPGKSAGGRLQEGGHVTSHCRSLLPYLLWNHFQNSSLGLLSGDGAGGTPKSSTKRQEIMAWVGGGTASFFPDTGGTEGLRHIMRQWKPCTPYPGWWPKDKTVSSISLFENSP